MLSGYENMVKAKSKSRSSVLRGKNGKEDGLNPKSEEALVKKGVALGISGKYNEAIKCYDKVLEINSKGEYIWVKRGNDWGKLYWNKPEM